MFSGKLPKPFLHYRSIGVRGGERYGVGVMDKSGRTADYTCRAHPGYVIVVVLRGGGSYSGIGGPEFQLGPGSCFQRFAGVKHTTRIDPSGGWLECFLELGASMAALLESGGFANPARPVLNVAVTPGLVERFVALGESFRDESDPELACRLPAILELARLSLTETAEGAEASRKRLLEQACAHLAGEFGRGDDLEEFCRRHGWGYENFRKFFRAQLGISPHRYRIRRRLDAACALLARPELSIAEIARQLGYASPYEFSAQFKRHLGAPPSAYRPAAERRMEPFSE